MSKCSPVKIGNRLIGAGQSVYVIAEAGVNHDGDPAAAHRLVEAASKAGADAVKFQVFSAERLAGPAAATCAYQRTGDAVANQREMLRKLELNKQTFVELQDHAAELGIDFLATPFGLPELNFLVETLQVQAIKIASSDLVNVPLLTAAAASQRTLVVSTGAARTVEVDQAVELIKRHGALDRLILLHCVSAYPTPPELARLACIGALIRRYGVPAGFSDHTTETTTGALAAAAGAVVLEKHLTLNRNAAGPDHFFSLEPEQFRQYVANVRRTERMLGDGHIGLADQEAEVRALSRGRLVSTRRIPAGSRLTADALMVQRPGDGIDPTHWEKVLACSARQEIPAETPLAWSMLK